MPGRVGYRYEKSRINLIQLMLSVAHRGIEPLFQEWKSCVLTDRRMGHRRSISACLSGFVPDCGCKCRDYFWIGKMFILWSFKIVFILKRIFVSYVLIISFFNAMNFFFFNKSWKFLLANTNIFRFCQREETKFFKFFFLLRSHHLLSGTIWHFSIPMSNFTRGQYLALILIEYHARKNK